VPGINDLVYGNADSTVFPVTEKMKRGKIARDLLNNYREAKIQNDKETAEDIKKIFHEEKFVNEIFRYFGYAFLETPEEAIPNVSIAFYSFHLMVILGFMFILVCLIALYLVLRGTIAQNKWFLWIALISIPLVYIASESGWVLAEMGRQPWIIQDLMPVSAAVTRISTGSVMTTFILFALMFTALLIAEVSIMVKQIKTGPKH
jgi:cytochrome d ubiquinol oxidase subunit I